MKFPRESGILLHPTSLPGPHGIGDLGDNAFRFVDWLERAGQRLWQVMPLNPTGFGDSPYSSPSAFAGNTLLISLSWLAGEGLLEEGDFRDMPDFPDHMVDFASVEPFKTRMLHRAFDRFRRGAAAWQRPAFETFCADEAHWLDDYALFMAVKEAHGGAPWREWEEPIRLRQPEATAEWSARVASEMRYHRFVQFQMRRQWDVLRRYANERGIRIVGDVPIFVADDSADVWTNRRLFKFDAAGNAVEVAGVPPDPFSETGQIWGNPVYNWPEMKKDGYRWWRSRAASLLKTVDIIRIDHFRGFAAAWVVPAGAESAASGHWELAPGGEVFAAIRRDLGNVPVIIEDLGVITPDVIALREILDLPGMNVLQFAFDGRADNVYLPHNYTRDSVVYTATHDNQTCVGWFLSRSEQERQAVQGYLGVSGDDIAWDLIRSALSSVANTAILSLQDVMRLDDSARMNVPGQPIGNWSWRYQAHQLEPGLADGLRLLTSMYGRIPGGEEEQGRNPWDYTTQDTAVPAIDPFAAR
ncbi:MAG TPA: 4-alpha-glucanotransferase [Thermomicrobiales bacterium]|nr:4-alpha-glucanotransferase [Thermomicrobiales bacterium]